MKPRADGFDAEPPCFDMDGRRVHRDGCDCPEERIRRATAVANATVSAANRVLEAVHRGDMAEAVRVALWSAAEVDSISKGYKGPETTTEFERSSRPVPELLGSGYYFAPFDMSVADAALLVAALGT